MSVRVTIVGCSRCGVRQEVPRWPLPGKTCACGGELSLTAGATQMLEKTLVQRAKQAGQDLLEGTIDDAGVLPLPSGASTALDEDPLEGTIDDAGVIPIPVAERVKAPPPRSGTVVGPPRSGAVVGPPRSGAVVGSTQEDARVLALPSLTAAALQEGGLATALPAGEGGGKPPRLGNTQEDARVLPIPDASAGLTPPPDEPAADPAPPPLVEAPSLWVAGYQLLEEIDQSASGTVYRAHDPRHDRDVALKVLDRLEPGARARFQRELLATARLRHPHIVGLLDSGQDEAGRPYLVLELVEGPSLAQSWSGPCFSAADVASRARVARDVARALAHGHAQGILHRDVKPETVLLDPEGRARLSDLGLARLGDSEGLTEEGEAYGTPAYMSPEQAAGGPVDARSDVYSLGATLYRGLAGHPPFEAGGVELFLAILRADPAPPSRSAPAVPPELDAVVLRCLHKDPAQRYPSAADLADDLERWLCGAAVSAPPAQRGSGRRPLPLVAAAAVGFLVGAAASQLLLTARPAPAGASSSQGWSPETDPIALLVTALLGLGLATFAFLAARAGQRRQDRQAAVEALGRWQAARAKASTRTGDTSGA